MKYPKESTKAELLEAHQEKISLKRARRNSINRRSLSNETYDLSKNADPRYRKSIWPEAKTATPGRMG